MFPIFCFARPRNKVDKIVIPDYTFFKGKIEEKEIDWDEQKKLILSKCKKLKNKQKDLIYFRGADTTEGTNLRSNIGKFLNKSKIIIYKNDKKRVPTYNFCKYKYLLDLPGKQPWSIRLKYLLLMPSTCIKVTQITKYTDENLIEEEWISFINTNNLYPSISSFCSPCMMIRMINKIFWQPVGKCRRGCMGRGCTL